MKNKLYFEADSFLVNTEVYLNSIKRIVINNIEYKKSNYKTSQEIQQFYYFIINNKINIQFVEVSKFSNKKETYTINIYIKNMKVHRLSGPAVIKRGNYINVETTYHFINGHYYSNEDFENTKERKNYYRSQKLKRICK